MMSSYILRQLPAKMQVRLTPILGISLFTFCMLFAAPIWGQFVRVGSAAVTDPNCYQLTDDLQLQVGGIWFQSKINLNFDMQISGSLYFGTNDNLGADGIGFVLQPVSNGLGNIGAGLGFEGVSPSLGVEFDCFQNVGFSDPVGDHIAVVKNGVLDHATANTLQGPITLSNLENGAVHPFVITWTAATRTLKVTLDGIERISYSNDIVANIFGGNPLVFWGFTGSTGAFSNIQGVCLTNYTFTRDKAITWTNGGGNNLWSNPNNWTDGIVPDGSKDVVFNSAADTDVKLDVDADVKSIDINEGYNGKLKLNDKTLTIKGGLKAPKKGTIDAGTSRIKFKGKQKIRVKDSLFNVEIAPPTSGGAPEPVTIEEDLNVKGDLVIDAPVQTPPADGPPSPQPPSPQPPPPPSINAQGDVMMNIPPSASPSEAEAQAIIKMNSDKYQALYGSGGGKVEIDKDNAQVEDERRIYLERIQEDRRMQLEQLRIKKGNAELKRILLRVLQPMAVQGKLSGTGSLKSPFITIKKDGSIAPGNSPGLLTIEGDLTLESGAILEFELTETNRDTLNVIGQVTLGQSTLNLLVTGSPILCSFTIIENDGTDPVIGTFNGLPEGSIVMIGNTPFRMSYVGGTGNDVTLSEAVLPVITCPTPLSINTPGGGCCKNNDLGICGAVITFANATAWDNCSVTVSQTSGLVSGSIYPVGTTTNVFVATDASGNTSSCHFSITITDNEKPTITAPAAVTSCTGTAVVLGTPVTKDNCGVQSVTNNAPTAFPNGTTTVIWTVTDVNGNLATATQTVSVLSIAGLTPSVTNLICNGGNNGQVNLTVAGGASPFTFSRSGNAATNTTGIFTGLSAGNYTFTVTDNNGCSKTATATITQPTAIVFGTPSVTNVLCNGGNNGKFVVAVTGGTGTKTFTISPNVGTQSPSGTFNNLTAGAYTITAKDANNCTKTTTVTVTQPLAINPNKCYTIINKKSGKVLDVYKLWTINNTKVIQYQANSGNNQKWRFTSVGNGFVKIVAQHSGKVLANHLGLNGSECYQYDYYTGGAKDWKVECLANGYFKIIHRLKGRVLDVESASTANEAEIEVKDWNGGDSQQWQIVETTCPTTTYNLSSNSISEVNASAEAGRNRIQFLTNQGFRTDFFEIEKQNTATGDFESLALLNNKQTGDAVQFHTIYDNNPDNGESHYRLKTTYISGDFEYSAIKTVERMALTAFTIFPNPATDEAFIDLKAFENRAVTLTISDLSGKNLLTEQLKSATSVPHRLDVSALQMGLYFVKVQAQGKREVTQKLQVVK